MQGVSRQAFRANGSSRWQVEIGAGVALARGHRLTTSTPSNSDSLSPEGEPCEFNRPASTAGGKPAAPLQELRTERVGSHDRCNAVADVDAVDDALKRCSHSVRVDNGTKVRTLSIKQHRTRMFAAMGRAKGQTRPPQEFEMGQLQSYAPC
jgi:hypothetical protein